MGYPIPANSPQIAVGARTFAVASYAWSNPMLGAAYNKVAIYELISGAWNEAVRIGEYENEGEMLIDVQAKGGIVKYCEWVKAQVNAAFAALFPVAPSTPAPAPSAEPTTDAAAVALVNTFLASAKLTLVNGVPVMQ